MALEGSSHADGARAAPPLQVDLRLGLPIIAAGIGVTALVAALEPEHAECRWCERSDLNPVDDWFRERFTSDDPAALEPILGAATGLSLLGTLGVYVASARHAGADWASVAQDGIVMVEAVSVTLALTALAKVAFARQRPYALDVPATQFAAEPRPTDENRSFFSGHTGLAFALAASAGTVASLREEPWAPWVWATGLSLGTVVMGLRLSQDEHYFTDLIAGAALGGGVGFALPYFLHRPSEHPLPVRLSLAPERGGSSLVASGSF